MHQVSLRVHFVISPPPPVGPPPVRAPRPDLAGLRPTGSRPNAPPLLLPPPPAGYTSWRPTRRRQPEAVPLIPPASLSRLVSLLPYHSRLTLFTPQIPSTPTPKHPLLHTAILPETTQFTCILCQRSTLNILATIKNATLYSYLSYWNAMLAVVTRWFLLQNASCSNCR